MDKKTFGQRLRYLREQTGLSQQQFALKCGVTQGTLSNSEVGKSVPGIDFLERIWEEHSHIRLEWLLTGKGSMLASDPPISANSPPMVEDELIREVAELRLMASRSSQAMARLIITALRTSPSPLSRQQLAEACDVKVDDIAVDLALLKRVGLVGEDAVGVRAEGYALSSGTAADSAEIALEVIDVMLRQVLPAADKNDGSARIIVAVGAVSGARQWMEELTDEVRRRLECEDGQELVTVILGITNSRR